MRIGNMSESHMHILKGQVESALPNTSRLWGANV